MVMAAAISAKQLLDVPAQAVPADDGEQQLERP
jgi:hypothetical protein